jgi:hypothetical protein
MSNMISDRDDTSSMISNRSSYQKTAVFRPGEAIRDARLALKGVDYDTMIGTGLSGALMVPTLARALRKKWAIIRKPDDGSHSEARYEGTIGSRWIFVDDFVSSGQTRDRVIREVERIVSVHNLAHSDYELHPFETRMVGSYLYEIGGFQVPSPPASPCTCENCLAV